MGGTGGYKYVYDAFGRLVELRKQNSDLVAAYRYSGLNQRITWHYDATGNGTTDGSDPVYHFCYDDKWRIVGVWRGADTDPKELFIYHNAGGAGMGGSSYIDSVILRDRDNSSKWTQASDGTLETRHYYAQNWRADVSAIFDNSGDVIEWQKYSAYGVPFLLTPGDHGKDGGISAADQTAFNADYAANSPRADLNRDGAWTTADQTLFTASYNAAAVGGRWRFSHGVANRKGYAGYEHEGFGNDLAAPEIAHVRHRVLHFELGRWTRRDPLGYVDGASLYAYTRSGPIGGVDPMGLDTITMRCRGIPLHFPPFFPLAQHCWVTCCSSKTGECHAYSLLPDPDSPLACIRRDAEPAPPETERPSPRPAPGWYEPLSTVASGREYPPGEVYKRKDGEGLCDCMESAFQANEGCKFDYVFHNCNSNWFAGSMWQCCTGDRGSGPIGAHWYGACDCSRPEVNFQCPSGNPGSDGQYRCIAEQ